MHPVGEPVDYHALPLRRNPTPMSRLRTSLAWPALAVLLATPLAAQECELGPVGRIEVRNHSIFDEEDLDGQRFAWAFGLANKLHIRTRGSFLRRELLLHEGDCYDPFLAADSERILRRYPFISQAEVFGVRQPDGTWTVTVETEDEWTTLVEMTGEVDSGFELRSVSASEENFLGRGMLLGAFLQQKDAERLVGLRFFTPRLFNSRTDLNLSVGQTRAGDFVLQELVFPFLGEVGRTGIRQSYSRKLDYFQYSAGTKEDRRYILLPTEQEYFEAAVARRWGTPGDLLVGGIGISRETLGFPNFETAVEEVHEGGDFDAGLPASASDVEQLRAQTAFTSGTRLNLMFAHRAIGFTQRTGLDALRGVHDLEIGSEVSLTLGKTITRSGGTAPHDVYSRLRIYGAGAPDPMTLIFDASVEGRQVFSGEGVTNDGWRDAIAEFDLLAYWQPGRWENHTIFGRLSGAGGWALDQPYQLTLGGRTGVRGFHEEDFPGARRVTLSIEDRIYLGWPAPNLFDLGLTLFGDAGRIWSGDVPFGVDSGWKGTVGGGLRFGFPSGSRGVVRIDIAWGVEGSGIGSPLLRISLADLIGVTSGLQDPQIGRSRRVIIGPDRFSPIR